MARRRNKPTELFPLFVILGLLWLVAQMLQDIGRGSDSVTIRVIVGASVALVVFLTFRMVRRFMTRWAILRQTKALVGQKLSALITQRAQLVQKDPYGEVRLDKWRKAIEYFVSTQLMPSLTRGQRKAFARNYSAVEAAIDKRVEAATRLQPAFQTFSADMTPSQFEFFCAEKLRQAGWDTRVTPLSRDQGADVVAEKNNLRVVLQCKLYSRPVGNKSVQEVVAARAHERAHYGVVVSNKNYTLAAQQLANTNMVFLLHYLDLEYLDDKLNGKR
jgi:hypothetical protein